MSQTSRPPHLHHELLFSHVLHRLPAKSLLRFTSVSKLWGTIIGGSKFVASHFHHSQSNSHLLGIFQGDNKSPHHLIFNLDDINFKGEGGIENLMTATIAGPYSFWIGSCNGLICFKSNFGFNILDSNTQETLFTRFCLQIYNPSTREVLVIPSPNQNSNEDTRGVEHYGFGFDPLNNEYKVVCMYNLNRIIWVYTLGTNSWRSIKVQTHMPDFFTFVAGVPVFSNGLLFWYTMGVGRVGGCEILSFDIHSEEVLMIPAPIDAWGNQPMFELQGRLCFADYHKGFVNLYKLNKDGNKHYWEKESICVTPGDDCILSRCVTGFVSFLNKVLFHWIHEGLLTLYDLHSGTKKVVKLLFDFRVFGCQILNHVENLLCLETFVPPGESKVVYVSYRDSQEEGGTDDQTLSQLVRRKYPTSCRL